MEQPLKPDQPLGDSTPVQTPTPTDLATPNSFRTPPTPHEQCLEAAQTFSKRRAVFEQTPRYKKAAGTVTADKSATSYKSASSSSGLTRGFFKRSTTGTAIDHGSSPECQSEDVRAKLKAAEDRIAQLIADLDGSRSEMVRRARTISQLRDDLARLQDESKRSHREDAESTTTTERSHRLNSSARKRGSSISAIRFPTLDENDLAERHKQLKKAEKELAALQQGNTKLNEVRHSLETDIQSQRQELNRITMEKEAEAQRLKHERDACATLESEKLSFIGEVATLTSTMETLRSRAADLEKSIETKSAELETVCEELTSRQAERESLRIRRDELATEIAEAEEKRKSLINLVDESVTKKNELEQEIADSIKERDNLKDQLDNLQSQSTSEETEIKKRQAELLELQNTLSELKSKIEKSGEEKERIEAETTKAQEHLTDIRKQHDMTNTDVKSKLSEIEKHDKRVAELTTQITKLETDLKQMRHDSEEATKRNKTLNEESQAVSKSLACLKGEVAKLEAAKTSLEAKLENLRQEETKITKSRDTLETERRQVDADLTAKKNVVVEVEKEMEAKRKTLADLERSSLELKNHCEKLTCEVASLQGEVDRLKNLVEANQKESTGLAEEIKSRQDEIQHFEQTISELKVMKTREHIAVQQVSKIEAEVCELEKRRQAASDELALIEDRKRIAKLDFVKLSSDCDALRQQIENLTSDLPSTSHKASSEHSRRASFSKDEFVLHASASNPEKLVAAQLREVRDRLTWDGERVALEKDRRRLEQERDLVQQSVSELELCLTKLQSEKESFEQKIEEQQKKSTSLQTDVEASKETLTQLKEDLKTTTAELTTTQEAVKSEGALLEKLRSESENERRHVQSLTADRDLLSEEILKLRDRLTGEELREKRVECEILEKESILKSLANQIAAADEELTLRVGEVGQIKSELERLDRAVADSRELVSGLRRECAEHEGVRTALMEKLRMEESEIRARSNAQIEEALAERERLRKAIEGMTTHYETLRRKAGELSRNLRPSPRTFCGEEEEVLIIAAENQTPSHNHRFSAGDSSPKSFADDQSYGRLDRHRGWGHNLLRRTEDKSTRRATLDFPRAECSPVSVPVEQPIAWMDSAGKHLDLMIGRMRSTTSTEEGLTQEDYVKQLEQELAYFKGTTSRRLAPTNT